MRFDLCGLSHPQHHRQTLQGTLPIMQWYVLQPTNAVPAASQFHRWLLKIIKSSHTVDMLWLSAIINSFRVHCWSIYSDDSTVDVTEWRGSEEHKDAIFGYPVLGGKCIVLLKQFESMGKGNRSSHWFWRSRIFFIVFREQDVSAFVFLWWHVCYLKKNVSSVCPVTRRVWHDSVSFSDVWIVLYCRAATLGRY